MHVCHILGSEDIDQNKFERLQITSKQYNINTVLITEPSSGGKSTIRNLGCKITQPLAHRSCIAISRDLTKLQRQPYGSTAAFQRAQISKRQKNCNRFTCAQIVDNSYIIPYYETLVSKVSRLRIVAVITYPFNPERIKTLKYCS